MIGKIVSWLMNDIIVKALANSKRFQATALRIDSFLHQNKKVIDEHVVKNGEKVVKEKLAKAKESRVVQFTQLFIKEMKQEVANELGKKNKLPTQK
mmetsp:Transcript_69828/g.137049  ORF Transcript_69828/g.137049 Transcript_69828/m.137049 type:complete len:96 (+) Transcript_69828:108-395(+)